MPTPLGPSALKAQVTAEDNTKYDELVTRINVALTKNYRGEGVVDFPIPRMPENRLQQRIIKDYVAAGWANVRFYESQKDGAGIELRMP